MNHHNTSVRHDALLGLRDIFQSHPDLLPKHLPSLVEQVFITVLDGSRAVRQTSHLLIETLLSSVSSDLLDPFFETLVAHLNCGLTHIKEKIQLDSLKILELYLKYCSQLLVRYIGNILVVLTGLLSRHKVASSAATTTWKGKSVNKKGIKSLTEKVLSPIEKGEASIGITADAAIGSATLINDPSSKLLNKSSRLRILKLIYSLLELLPVTTPGSTFQVFLHDVFDALEGGEGFVKVCGGLVSILMESWVESYPDNVFRGKGYPAVQSLYLMEIVINMLCMLLKLILRLTQDAEGKPGGKLILVDFFKKIASDVSSRVMCHFPFGVATSSVQKQFQQFYVMNFTLCEIALLLWKLLSPVNHKVTDKLILVAMQYLSSLSSNDVTSSVQIPTCSKIMANLAPLLYALSLTWSGPDSLLVGTVFTYIRDFYLACHPHSRSKRLLVKCFSGMFVQELERRESR